MHSVPIRPTAVCDPSSSSWSGDKGPPSAETIAAGHEEFGPELKLGALYEKTIGNQDKKAGETRPPRLLHPTRPGLMISNGNNRRASVIWHSRPSAVAATLPAH